MAYKDIEKNREYNRQYMLKNRERLLARKREVQKVYAKTPMGRAGNQIQQYKRMDERNGFGCVIDFDARWMVDNIYTKPCPHCGETDWRKLGCNRLDNSKPHTKDNVEPCCFHCNCKLNGTESDIGERNKREVLQYNKNDTLVGTYGSLKEASEITGVNCKNISSVISGKRKTAGGYIWKGK